MIGARFLLQRARRAAKRTGARGLILIYHRVAAVRNDPWRLSVTPENFASQLETLRQEKLRIVHVAQLAAEVAERRIVGRTVALSFDDGYADNFWAARPLLERFDVPATLFATSGYIGSDEEFWWDALERVLLQPGELPATLQLDLPDGPLEWSLGLDRTFTPASADRCQGWRPFERSPTMRHRIHDELWLLFVALEPATRSRAVAALLHWAGLGREARSSRRALTKDELRHHARDDLVEVGAHSVTHPSLGVMPRHIRRHEIQGSKAQIEGILGRPVRGFSYPQGRSSAEVQQETREAGYAFACGSTYEAIGAHADVFHLPRVSARDWNGTRLRSLLAQHMAF